MRTAFILLLICLLAFPGEATTVVPMSVEELTRAASRVVEAEVVESWSEWNPQHTRIYTYSRVRVRRALKGTPEALITVKELGGTAGGYAMKVSGVRELQTGEQAVLFLRPSRAADGTWVIVGLMQGHFRLYSRGEWMMVSNGVRASTVHEKGAKQTPAAGPMTLQQLERRIQGALTR